MKLEIHYVVTYKSGRISRFWSRLDEPVESDGRIDTFYVDAIRTETDQVIASADEMRRALSGVTQ
jgi:hypothetical protein